MSSQSLDGQNIDELVKAKDNAYWERNQLVAALSKVLPSFLSRHPDDDKDWDDDWRNIVVMTLPANLNKDFIGAEKVCDYQLTWHIHDHDLPMFDHLRFNDYWWDGHTTQEKYRRLRSLVQVNDLAKNSPKGTSDVQ